MKREVLKGREQLSKGHEQNYLPPPPVQMYVEGKLVQCYCTQAMVNNCSKHQNGINTSFFIQKKKKSKFQNTKYYLTKYDLNYN